MARTTEHTVVLTEEEIEAIASSVAYTAALIGLRSASSEVRVAMLPELTGTIELMVEAWEHQVDPDEGLFATINAKCKTALGLPISNRRRA